MAGKRLFSASLAVLVVVGLAAVAYQWERARRGSTAEAIREVGGERLASLDGIEERLKRLEVEAAALRGESPADTVITKGAAVPDEDRWAALESSLASLQLRVKGLEEDPMRLGEAYLASENPEMRREGINTLRRVAKFDPKARAAIRGLLHDPSSRVREQAAQVLKRLKDKESAPDMKVLLADPDARTRYRAVQALGTMDARDASGEIGRILLSDGDDGVRVAAADALGKLKAQEADAILTEALKDKNDKVRGEAIASLGKIGATSAVPQLRAIYDQDPGNHRVRLVLALKSLGDALPLEREVGRLSEILKSETDQRVRQQAQRELAILTRNNPQ